jgi:hypothetical protein
MATDSAMTSISTRVIALGSLYNGIAALPVAL